MMPASSIRYSWVADLRTGTFLANSRESVRVMGVVVALGGVDSFDRTARSPLVKNAKTESRDENAPPQVSSAYRIGTGTTTDGFFSITIDDGTDSISVCAPRTLMESSPAPSIEVGKTYDCILKLRQDREKKTWFADALIEIDNPMDEHFRWLELGHHDQSLSKSQSSRFRYSNLCHKFGFPMRKRNSLEAYRLICVNSRLQQQQQQQQQQQPPPSQRKKQTIPIRSTRSVPTKKNPSKRVSRPSLLSRPRGLQNIGANNGNRIQANRQENFKRRLSQPKAHPIPKAQVQAQAKRQAQPQSKPLEGLLLRDLAMVLQKSERNVQEMIEDLQLEGKIYQNERGEYLPL